MTKTTIRLALLAALAGGSIAAHADRAITVSTKPFDAALPIAPAKLPASAAPARSVAPVVAAAPVHAPVVYDVSLRDKTIRPSPCSASRSSTSSPFARSATKITAASNSPAFSTPRSTSP